MHTNIGIHLHRDTKIEFEPAGWITILGEHGQAHAVTLFTHDLGALRDLERAVRDAIVDAEVRAQALAS